VIVLISTAVLTGLVVGIALRVIDAWFFGPDDGGDW
jgi:hypothetical protein